MIRLLIFFALLYLLYRLLRAVVRVFLLPSPGAPGEVMEKDPCCGVYIPRSEAHTLRRRRRTYYFCSETCRQRWKKGQGQHCKGEEP